MLPIIRVNEKEGVFFFPNGLLIEADEWMSQLETLIEFTEERPIACGGPNEREPRDVLYFGDANVMALRYSVIRRTPKMWPPFLDSIRLQLQELLPSMLSKIGIEEVTDGHRLNALLLNYYKNGKDSMGFHRDDNPCLSPTNLIVSVSLGTTREFCLRKFSLKQEEEQKERSRKLKENRLNHAGHEIPPVKRQIPKEEGATNTW